MPDNIVECCWPNASAVKVLLDYKTSHKYSMHLKQLLQRSNSLTVVENIRPEQRDLLNQYGQRVVKDVVVGDYNVILLYSESLKQLTGVGYQVGFQRQERDFTSVSNQHAKITPSRVQLSGIRAVLDQVLAWIDRYGPVIAGSENLAKNKFYKKVFRRYRVPHKQIELLGNHVFLLGTQHTQQLGESGPSWLDLPLDQPQGPFYHGTSSALNIGHRLLPPDETNRLSELGRKKNLDRVFFTADLGSARIYAGKAVRRWGGEAVIYQVYPVGPVEEIQSRAGTTVYAAPWALIEPLKTTNNPS